MTNPDRTSPPSSEGMYGFGLHDQTDQSETVGAHLTPMSRTQVLRIVRMGKNFEQEVRRIPNGQQYIQEHQDLVSLIRRQDPGSIEGRF